MRLITRWLSCSFIASLVCCLSKACLLRSYKDPLTIVLYSILPHILGIFTILVCCCLCRYKNNSTLYSTHQSGTAAWRTSVLPNGTHAKASLTSTRDLRVRELRADPPACAQGGEQLGARFCLRVRSLVAALEHWSSRHFGDGPRTARWSPSRWLHLCPRERRGAPRFRWARLLLSSNFSSQLVNRYSEEK